MYGIRRIFMNEDKFYQEIGQRISEERLKAGIKQEDLANFLELSRASIVNIEKGRQRASTFVILNIARYLKVDFNSLIPVPESSSSSKESKKTVSVAEFASEWNLNSSSKKSLEDFVDLITK